MQAEIRNIEKQLRPNWLRRQFERVRYNACIAAKAFSDWLRPKPVEEKNTLFKAPDVRVEGVLKEPAKVKELPRLNVKDILRVAAKQEDKRDLLQKSRKHNLLPKKTPDKGKGLGGSKTPGALAACKKYCALKIYIKYCQTVEV